MSRDLMVCFGYLLLLFLLLGMFAAAIFWAQAFIHECQAMGGAVVNGPFGLACVAGPR